MLPLLGHFIASCDRSWVGCRLSCYLHSFDSRVQLIVALVIWARCQHIVWQTPSKTSFRSHPPPLPPPGGCKESCRPHPLPLPPSPTLPPPGVARIAAGLIPSPSLPPPPSLPRGVARRAAGLIPLPNPPSPGGLQGELQASSLSSVTSV